MKPQATLRLIHSSTSRTVRIMNGLGGDCWLIFDEEIPMPKVGEPYFCKLGPYIQDTFRSSVVRGVAHGDGWLEFVTQNSIYKIEPLE